MCFLYILYSASRNKYYIGHTNNITIRLEKHNSNHKGFTGKTGDWIIAYSEKYSTKKLAFAREREIKTWKSRIMIEKLISSEPSD